MSRVRDKADFQFAGEDYTHGGGVKYVANMIQTTDLDASGTISNVHLQDIADVASVSSSNDGHFLKYDHSTTAFVWAQASGGGGGGSMNDLVDDTSPQLGGDLYLNAKNITGNGNIDINGHFHGINIELETIEPTLQFKRLNNANVPSIKWLGQSGVEGANIKFDGTNGNTNQLIFETYDSTTLAERFRITYDGASVTGDLHLDSGGVRYTFNVSASGSSAYTFTDTAQIYFPSNANNPDLYLKRGEIYKFSLNASGHPFYIKTVAGTGTGNQYTSGVTGNGTQTGDLIFKVPMNAPDTLYYQCSSHGAMVGTINIMGAGGGGASTGDISFSASTISSSGSTITLDDDVTVTGALTSSQAGSPIITSASSLTLQASDRVHVNQSPLRLYNVSTTNRNLLTAADGDMVYDSTLNETFAYHNGSWTSLSGGGGGGSATDILTITTTSSVPPTAPSSGSVNIYEDNSTLTFQNSRAGTGHYQLKMENSAGTFLMGVDGLGNIVTSTTGTMRAQYFYAVSNTSYYVAPALTTTAMQLAGDMKTDGSYIGSIKERSNADTTTSGTLDFDSKDYEIYRLTQSQTANRTLNIRGDGSASLDSIMSNNEFRTVAIAFKNGSTPYYFNAFEIDGSAVTPLWSGGSAPSAGNASSTDFYTFSICKTGSATFEVYGSFTKYA